MKKLILFFVICFGMIACSGNNQSSDVNSADTISVDSMIDTISIDTIC